MTDDENRIFSICANKGLICKAQPDVVDIYIIRKFSICVVCDKITLPLGIPNMVRGGHNTV